MSVLIPPYLVIFKLPNLITYNHSIILKLMTNQYIKSIIKSKEQDSKKRATLYIFQSNKCTTYLIYEKG